MWRSVAQREKSVSVTGKHLLIRNKKQKAAEPVTEQAIRKAFCKLKSITGALELALSKLD